MIAAFPKPVHQERDPHIRNCRGCKLLFRISRKSSRFCPRCFAERRERKRETRPDRRRRDGTYPKPEGKWWYEQKKKNAPTENACEVCGRKESKNREQFGCGLTRDHILPVRFITHDGLGDPHLDLNIKLTCTECCANKTRAEAKLFSGDVLGFVSGLKKGGWDMQELQQVLIHYRFYPKQLEHFFK